MKKLLLYLPILLLFSSCIKKKQQNSASSATTSKMGSAKFDGDVEEFVLEDDSDGNVFENNGSVDADALDLEDVTLDGSDNEVVQFEFDRTDVKPEEHSKIERNSEVVKKTLSKNPNAKVVVDGHSCKIAKSETYNYMISQERADKVANEYAKTGISKDKIKAVGHGDTVRLTNADGKKAQAINRRAETKVIA